MTYDKPEIRDFGNIAEHTYTTDCNPDFACESARLIDDVKLPS